VPETPTDRHHIYASINKLRRVRTPERVKHYVAHFDRLCSQPSADGISGGCERWLLVGQIAVLPHTAVIDFDERTLLPR